MIKNNSSIPTICEEIGERLKRLRLNENLTQTQLGELCGTSRKLIAKAEHGRGDLAVIIAMLKVLGQADRIFTVYREKELRMKELDAAILVFLK